MAWIQLKIGCQRHDADPLSDLLMEYGAEAVTFLDAADQPILEPGPGETPLWQDVVLVGLFDAGSDTQAILDSLEKQPLWENTTAPEWEQLRDQDWERSWMDNFKPMQFGQRLWIVPSWHQPPEPDAVNILLDPGLAFGTGSHATTALCLAWLEQAELSGKSVIDYGCGSGVLTLAALMLGADKVSAVDIDPQAITATRENLQRNRLDANRLEAGLPDAVSLKSADVLVANILAAPLRELAPTLAGLVRPGGRMALSGLLREQAEELIRIYSEWFQMAAPEFREDWALIHGQKK